MKRTLRRVYLIDDDPTFNFITKLLLKKISFADEIIDFMDASEALARLQNTASDPQVMPDLIFLDLNMPGMDGWDFLDVYKTLPATFLQQCKLYILTSSIDPSDKSKSLSYQCVTDFITKPLGLDRVTKIKEEFSGMMA
jgi:CheY-like chemotaxis protein